MIRRTFLKLTAALFSVPFVPVAFSATRSTYQRFTLYKGGVDHSRGYVYIDDADYARHKGRRTELLNGLFVATRRSAKPRCWSRSIGTTRSPRQSLIAPLRPNSTLPTRQRSKRWQNGGHPITRLYINTHLAWCYASLFAQWVNQNTCTLWARLQIKIFKPASVKRTPPRPPPTPARD